MGEWGDYSAADGAAHTVIGNVKILKGLVGPGSDDRRDLLAYLPPSYETQPGRRYPVIYMHDGQNLFDEVTSFSGEWRVDETMEELAKDGVEAIVVGVPNLGKDRIGEYSPFPDPEHGGGGGDQYLTFVARVVKPLVDASFRTAAEPDQTFMAGSSMGGLISLYAALRFPETYGGVAALSPSLWFAKGAIFRVIAQAPPMSGKIYLDIGTAEPRRAVHHARRMRRLLHEKGLDAGHSLLYVEEAGAGHGEQWWAGRFKDVARWLLTQGPKRD